MTTRLDVGGVLDRVFELYRMQAAIILPAAAVVFLLPAIAVVVLRDSAAAVAVVFVVALVAGFWYQGVVVQAVQDVEEDGKRDFSVTELFASAGPFVWPLIAAGFVLGLGVFLGLLLFVVPGLVLLTWWALVPPVIVLERSGVGEAFGRSRELVRGHGWRVFGIIVLLLIVQLLAASILRNVALAISDTAVSEALGNYLGNILVAPLTAIAATVVYLRLRGPRPPVAGDPVAAGPEEEHHGFRPPAAGPADQPR